MIPDDCSDLIITERGERVCAETGFIVTEEDCRVCLMELEDGPEDIAAEGYEGGDYKAAWNRINPKTPWDDELVVWVVEFEMEGER